MVRRELQKLTVLGVDIEFCKAPASECSSVTVESADLESIVHNIT